MNRIAKLSILLFLSVSSSWTQPGPDDLVTDSTTLNLNSGQFSDSTIREIQVLGNRVTKVKVITRFLQIDTGMVYDSLRVAEAAARLKSTNLFLSVSVFPHFRKSGVRLYVIVKEKFYYSLEDYGGDLYSYRYGEKDFWWRARLGFARSNFRGSMETLRLRFEIWEARALGLSWTKPLLSTPYSVSAGFDTYNYPDRATPWRTFTLSGVAGVNRRLSAHSKIGMAIAGIFTELSYHGPSTPGDLGAIPLGPAPVSFDDSTTPPARSDTTWVDTVISKDTLVEYRWNGHRYYLSDQSQIHDYSALLSISHLVDHRDASFNPHEGWLLRTSASTNALYSEEKKPYLQLDLDGRIYIPGLFRSNTMALRVQTTLRSADAGWYRNLRAGGDDNIRGYGKDRFGIRCHANNRLIVNAEYRFPIGRTPTIDLLGLEKMVPDLKGFYYQLDGTFFIDGGYLWHQIENPLSPQNENEHGLGAGFGLRILAPTIKIIVCFDVGFPLIEDKLTSWIPPWYLYINMNF